MSLAKRSADTALMPPPPLTKRIKRPPKVLDEDVYSEAMSHIIARDFFPGLQESQAQQDFMDALDNGDKGSMVDFRLDEQKAMRKYAVLVQVPSLL